MPTHALNGFAARPPADTVTYLPAVYQPMDATRRRYLQYAGGAALPASLAGCIGTVPETNETDNGTDTPIDNDTDNATDGGNETRPTGTGGPGVTIAATDDDPEIPIQPAVEIVREAATTDHPPRLRTTLTNTSEEAVSVGEGRAVHFEYVTADSGTLILLPADDDYPAEANCWRLTDLIETTEEYRTFEIAASESSSRPVDLYATTEADGCLPVGDYRFETTISLPGDDAESESAASWGFSVGLE